MGIKEATLEQGSASAAAPTSNWHMQETVNVLNQLSVKTDEGLDTNTVAKRIETYGTNELVEKGLTSPWAILWEQLTNPLVMLLLLAAGISLVLGKVDSVIAIMAIVVLNAVLGVFQEYRAEQAMAALKKMAAPLVRVRRERKVLEIASRELVPGDMILLEAGSIIPADCTHYRIGKLTSAGSLADGRIAASREINGGVTRGGYSVGRPL